MKKLNVQKLTLCGVMAALVFVMTYFPKIPVPVTGGYVHLGDGAIFLSVLLLGPLGIPAAAVGSMLSDLIGGYMVYVLPTFLIKGLVALVAWKLCRKDQPLLALLSFLLAEAVMVLWGTSCWNGRCTALHRQPRRLARMWCRASRAC